MSARPWLDADLDPAGRAALLLGQMSTAEKVGQLHQVVNVDPESDAQALSDGRIGSSLWASGSTAGNVRDEGVPRDVLDRVQRIAVEDSRLGVPLLFARDVIHGYRTVFPIPLGQAATFDPELVQEAARVTAGEARGDGIAWTFSPMLDIGADARWGRVAESYGEDALLTSDLGAATIRGYQGDDLSGAAMAACAKHYVGYALSSGGRDYAEADVGPVMLRNRYLRPFEAAVAAGTATVMTAFSTVDSVPMTAHAGLVRGYLKESLGYDGTVVTDWDGVGDLVRHQVAGDLREAARQAMAAGIDMDMVAGAYDQHLADLLGTDVTAAQLDDAVRRVLELKFRLGLFEQPYVPERPAVQPWTTAGHTGLARRAARESMVLLRNEGVLPLREPRHIYVTGPLATADAALLGTWCLDGRAEDVRSVPDALRARYPDAEVVVDDGRHSDLTLVRARAADVVIACVGEHPQRSGENNSVSDLGLPPGQTEVLEALRELATPVVAVVFTGRPLALTRVVDAADAVLVAWHPGTQAGPALVDLLSGDHVPAGRLPMTFPRRTGQVPIRYDALPTSAPVPLEEALTTGRYRDVLDLPLFPFGYGLGYSPVSYGAPRVARDRVPVGEPQRVTVEVSNDGALAARETVQVYLRDPVAAVSRPVRELVAYRKVDLAPGERATVEIEVPAAAMSYVDATGTRRTDPGAIELTVGPDAQHGDQVTFHLVTP